MLKIGEFAGFCGLPVKTLRYYNEIDLLKPYYIDPLTKYRFYDEDQLKRLILILDLKDVGFTLTEISVFLENSSNTVQLENLLREKSLEIEENIKRDTLKLENIKSISARMLAEAPMNSHKSDNKVVNEIDEKVITLDTCTSIERHTLEEAIWL
ncbi:MAG: MerR family transcriptional regulator [Mobilitalea sp.]